MIEILIYLSSAITFFWVGYETGRQMPKNQEGLTHSREQTFKEGYVKGYGDCLAAIEEDREYYDKFPPMSVN